MRNYKYADKILLAFLLAVLLAMILQACAIRKGSSKYFEWKVTLWANVTETDSSYFGQKKKPPPKTDTTKVEIKLNQ
jgi:ABC-type oligopeptide transport system substrate-binding subunit